MMTKQAKPSRSKTDPKTVQDKAKKMVKTGRPKGSYVIRTPETKQAIVDAIARGKTLAQVCRELGIQADFVSVWRLDDPAFNEAYARARDAGYDRIADECLAIADTPFEELIVSENMSENGISTTRTRKDAILHRKLQIETRLKLLAVWDPKRYGNRLTHAGDAENPVTARMELIQSAADKFTSAIIAASSSRSTGEDAE